jgi:hypothetical protein
MSLSGAISKIQTLVSAVSGLNAGTYGVTDDLSPAPFVVTSPASGEINTEAYGINKCLHTIRCEIHVPEADYPRYRSTLIDAIEATKTTLLDPANAKLDGNVDAVQSPIRYTFGPMKYGGAATYGLQFDIEVKIRS